MELLIEFAKLLIPALAVLYAMYLTITSFLTKDLEKKVMEYKMKNTELILPIRLQAYERMCLFLERITPNNMVVRLNDSTYTARQFQQILLLEIREEYYHNLSQQVYMTDDAWALIKNAMEDTVVTINAAAKDLPDDARGIDLAKQIFERLLNQTQDPIGYALKSIKNEIRNSF